MRGVLLLAVSASACAEIIGADEWTPKETDARASAAPAASGAGGASSSASGGAGGASTAGSGGEGGAETTCKDSVKNGMESGVDCGGPTDCPRCDKCGGCMLEGDCQSGCCFNGICLDMMACSSLDTCTDGCHDANETDVDCGGMCPDKCPIGSSCIMDRDCAMGLLCKSKKCSDGL